MKTYNELSAILSISLSGLKGVVSAVGLIKTAIQRRYEPVPKHVGNKEFHRIQANEILDIARKEFETSLGFFKMDGFCDIKLPDFDALVKLYEEQYANEIEK